MRAFHIFRSLLTRNGWTPSVAIIVAVGLIANPIELSEGDLGYPLSGYNLNAVDYVTVDSRRMRVQAVEEKHAFSIAAKDTYRFETRKTISVGAETKRAITGDLNSLRMMRAITQARSCGRLLASS